MIDKSRIVAILMGFLALCSLTAQTPELVKNIETGPSEQPPRNPARATAYGDSVYMILYDDRHGNEPWIYRPGEGLITIGDTVPGIGSIGVGGGPFGTLGDHLVLLSSGVIYRMGNGIEGLEPMPVREGLNVNGIFVLGQRLIIRGWDNQYGSEIWVSDNFSEPVLLVDAWPGASSSNPSQVVVAGDRVFFWSNTPEGQRLWVSDGAPEGTRTINFPEPNLSISGRIDAFGNRIAFSAFAANGAGYWVSDGTDSGTVKVSDRNFLVSDAMTFGDQLYLNASIDNLGNEVWRVNGSEFQLVADIEPGSVSSSPFFAGATSNHLFFTADTQTHGRELWATDGETVQRITNLGAGSGDIELDAVFVFDNTFYFFADHEAEGGLYRSDGTPDGTALFADTELDQVAAIVNHGNRVTLLDETNTPSFWSFDGTELTHMGDAADAEDKSSQPGHLTQVGNRLFFGVGNHYLASDKSLYVTEGRHWNTHRISDFAVNRIMAAGDKPLLESNHPSDGLQLFVIDDQEQLQQLDLERNGNVDYSVSLHDKVVFGRSAYLYVSDGTAAGTVLLNDEVLRIVEFEPDTTAVLGDNLYFLAGFGPYDLWRTDGTVEGTELVGEDMVFSPSLGRFRNHIYYDHPGDSRTLIKSDGTLEGARVVSYLPGGNDSIDSYTITEDGLYFTLGLRLMKTDGQTLADAFDLPTGTSDIEWVETLNRNVVLAHLETPDGYEIWRTSGSNADSYRILGPMSFGNRLVDYGILDGVLYYSSLDETGRELWRSDGTLPGNYRLADIAEGFRSSLPQDFAVTGSQLYFSAWTPETGRELYQLCASMEPELTVPTEICAAENVTAVADNSGPGAVYTWNLTGGTLINGQGSRQIGFIADGGEPVNIEVMVSVPGNCSAVSQRVIPVRYLVPEQPTPISGLAAVCSGDQGEPYSVAADPEATGYVWTVPPGAVISEGQGTNQIRVHFGSQGGMIEVRPVNACGEGPARELNVTLSELPNSAHAGDDMEICGVAATLNANAPSAGNTGTWIITSGIGGVISNPQSPTSDFQGLPGEIYRLEWRIQSPVCGESSDDVWVRFYRQPDPADAGPDLNSCTNQIWLEATEPLIGTGRWEVVSATGPYQEFDRDRYRVQFTGTPGHTYELRWDVTSGACPVSSDNLTVWFLIPPPTTLSAGLDQVLAIDDIAELRADDGWPGRWSVLSGPSTSVAQFSDPTDPRALFTPLGGIGVYELEWRVDLGCALRVDSILLSFDLDANTPGVVPTSFGGPLPFQAERHAFDGSYIGMAEHPELGYGLWRGDDSGGNAELLYNFNDVLPNIEYLGILGDHLYFAVIQLDGAGSELWRTDGTPVGTGLFMDINPGAGSSYPGYGVLFDGMLYFSADGPEGRELWRTDGTLAGTRVAVDIVPGSAGTSPREMVVMNGVLYFTAIVDKDGLQSRELWRSDGTPEGTWSISSIGTESSANAGYLRVAGSRIFFLATAEDSGRELWSSDGTPAGTQLILDFVPGGDSGRYGVFTPHGNELFFMAKVNFVDPWRLWASDGTSSGTRPLLPDLEIFSKASYNGFLHFNAENNSGERGLYRTDGTAADVTLIRNHLIISGNMVDSGGKLYFAGQDANGSLGSELWVSDGSEAGTNMVRDMRPGPSSSAPGNLIDIDGTLFFHFSQRLWYYRAPAESGAAMSAPPQLCAVTGHNQAEIEGLPHGTAIHWTIANGSITGGQNADRVEFQAGMDGMTVLVAELELPDGEKSVLHLTIPVLGGNYDAWNQGPGPFDLDQNGQTDIRDLILIREVCR